MEAQRERGDECLHGEKINVESWEKTSEQRGVDASKGGGNLFTEECYSRSREARCMHKQVLMTDI